jgi:predicted transcriptional regulator YdeE
MFLRCMFVETPEPRMITLDAPMKVIGVSMRTSMKTICKDAVTLGKEYRKIKAQNLIKNRRTPWLFVAISTNLSEDKTSWDYTRGDVVTTFDNIPEGLTVFEILCMTYAVFTIRPKFGFLWGPAIETAHMLLGGVE